MTSFPRNEMKCEEDTLLALLTAPPYISNSAVELLQQLRHHHFTESHPHQTRHFKKTQQDKKENTSHPYHQNNMSAPPGQ